MTARKKDAKATTRKRPTRQRAEARRKTKPEPVSKLAAKWATILGELDAIPRRGHARVETRAGGVFEYDYVLESDLMEALRPKLAAYGIAAFYSDEILDVTPLGKGWYTCRVRVRLELVDAETGETKTVSSDDEAADYGDKAARKAKTGAMRYLLNKGTLNPSDASDDPDAAENVVERPEPEPEHKPEPEQRTAASGSSRTTPTRTSASDSREPRPIRLRRTIVQRANDYDEASEQKPGSTLGSLVAELGEDLDTLDEDRLVFVGTSIAKALEEARVLKQDGSDVPPFRLPEEGRPAPF